MSKQPKITVAQVRAEDAVELLLTHGIKTFIRALSDDIWRQSVSPYARRLYENALIHRLNQIVSTQPIGKDWLLEQLLQDPDVHDDERIAWSKTRNTEIRLRHQELGGTNSERRRDD